MLRKIMLVSLIALTFASCKKDKDDAPSYHFSAKVNGEKKDFNASVTAVKQSMGGLGYFVIVNGMLGNASSPYPSFTLTISDDAAIKAGTYTATQYQADGMYSKTNSEEYDSDTDFSIVVSSISDTEVKGTFSGKVENGATVLTITEGTFSAKFQ